MIQICIVMVKTCGWNWDFEANFHHELLNYWQSKRIMGGFWLAEFRNILHFKIDSLFALQIWV